MNKQTKFLISIAICYCLVIKPDAIGAQTLDEELKKCSEITVSLIRLQCYDRLSKAPEVRSAKPSNQTKRRNIFQRRSRDNAVKQEEQKTTTEETSTDSPVANESDNVFINALNIIGFSELFALFVNLLDPSFDMIKIPTLCLLIIL